MSAHCENGLVVEIFAQPGTQVRKGQLLARLDDREISDDVEAAGCQSPVDRGKSQELAG